MLSRHLSPSANPATKATSTWSVSDGSCQMRNTVSTLTTKSICEQCRCVRKITDLVVMANNILRLDRRDICVPKVLL